MRPSRLARASSRPSWCLFWTLGCWFSAAFAASSPDDGTLAIELVTKDAVAREMDTYTYTSAAMPDEPHYIARFEPKADMSKVHHMLLFGCEGLAASTKTRSGGMFSGGGQARGTLCLDSASEPFLFGWGMNAPDLVLPDNVGFRVGPGGFRHLVLEVHYLVPQPPDAPGESGLVAHLRPGVPDRPMSVIAYAQGFTLPPRRERVDVHNTCCYVGARPLEAFAFRVHTHALGREVYLERMTAGAGFRASETDATANATANAEAPPTRLMGRDPQLPQLFERLETRVTIRPGDKLRATCSFDTRNRTTTTRAGWGHGDEMCNLYLMVHAEEPAFLSCTGSAGSGSSRFAVQHAPEGGARKAAPNPSETFLVDVPAPGAPDAGWPSSFGQVADVAFEPDGRHAWVFHRGSRIWTADSFDGGALRRVTRDAPIPENTVARVCLTSGKITRTFGAGEHYMPHGLTLGPDGDVWIVDAGLHQVIRYDAETGERVAAYGAKLEPGRGADGFCMPTDVAVAEDNSFWVADGYCASRIARFDASGAYVGEWSEGETNEASTNASSYATSSYSATPSYSTPHAVALDSCRSRLFVADRERARVVVHRADGGVVCAHDLSAHGKVYGLAVLRSEDQGMHGFYALCWRRGPDGRSGAVRLVARWFAGGANGVGTTAHWDLPGVTAPHMLDVVSGGVGGTAAFGRGISLLVAETRPNVGDANLRRAWLGDGGGARDRERTHRGDDDTRHLVVAPARGWTPDSEPAVDVPALGSRRETAEAAKATKIAERASEPSIASAGDADTDARSYDDDDDDADEDQVRLPAPQHGGGGGGILPGGGLVVERGSMEGVASGRSPLAAAAAAAAAMVVACAIARGRGGGARRGMGIARLRLDVDPKRAGAAGREAGFRAARRATREIEMQP